MKRTGTWILSILLALIALMAIVVGVLRFGFDYDLFERGGWSRSGDGTYRFLKAGGQPVLGWTTIEGNTYYLDPIQNGAVYTGWLDTDQGRCYLDKQGVRAEGWTEIDGVQYCFGADGRLFTGWQDTEYGRAYFNAYGLLQSGWLELDGVRYYLDEHGVPCIGWQVLEGMRCCFDESGALLTGWVEKDGARCYLDENGVLQTGWLELDGKRYFLTQSGAAQTGWMEVGEDRYYFHADGVMAVGRVEIDGTACYFTSAGKYFVLVNPWNHVPADYEWDLVDYQGYQIQADCLEALEAMVAACRAAGYSCNVNSAYRSYDRQVFLFERKVTRLMERGYSRTAAEQEAALSIAIPGTSEHQLGLAVDIKSGNATYSWLAKHSWEYGFILRYPYGKTEVTGIYYEPWHFRYVGTELAQELYELDLCVEEYMDLLTEQAGAA